MRLIKKFGIVFCKIQHLIANFNAYLTQKPKEGEDIILDTLIQNNLSKQMFSNEISQINYNCIKIKCPTATEKVIIWSNISILQ